MNELPMGDHTVIVWDEPQTVTTYRKYKTVWVASGEYKGESHSTEDSTEGAAIMRWREWAHYKGG
jgi:hypothetical protein